MQALRVCRTVARPLAAVPRARMMATAALPQSASDPNIARPSGSVVPLNNIEAHWEKLSAEDQAQVYTQLEEAMKKDWTTLSMQEKKAGACARRLWVSSGQTLTHRSFLSVLLCFSAVSSGSTRVLRGVTLGRMTRSERCVE